MALPFQLNYLVVFEHDHEGIRVTKTSSAEDILFINKFTEKRNSDVIRYVFSGSQKVAAVTTSTVHYIHPDHLGEK